MLCNHKFKFACFIIKTKKLYITTRFPEHSNNGHIQITGKSLQKALEEIFVEKTIYIS